VTPIAVTTGVGPKGHETVLMQPPSDDEGVTNSRFNTPDSGFGSLTAAQEESFMADIMTSTNGMGFGNFPIDDEITVSFGAPSFDMPAQPAISGNTQYATNFLTPFVTQPGLLLHQSLPLSMQNTRRKRAADTEISSGSEPPASKVRRVAMEDIPLANTGAKCSSQKVPRAPKPSQAMGNPKSGPSGSKKKKKQQLKKQTFESIIVGSLK